MRVGTFVGYARLADTGFPSGRRHLPVAVRCELVHAAALLELGFASDEWGETPPDGRLQPRSHRTGAGRLIDFDRLREAPDGHRSERLDLDKSFHQAKGVTGEANSPGGRKLLHARREMGRLPDRGVVHPEVAPHGSNQDLAGVQPNADLDFDTVPAPCSFRALLHRVLHPERGVARPARMTLMRDR